MESSHSTIFYLICNYERSPTYEVELSCQKTQSLNAKHSFLFSQPVHAVYHTAILGHVRTLQLLFSTLNIMVHVVSFPPVGVTWPHPRRELINRLHVGAEKVYIFNLNIDRVIIVHLNASRTRTTKVTITQEPQRF